MNPAALTFRKQRDQLSTAEGCNWMTVNNRHHLALILYFVPATKNKVLIRCLQCFGTGNTYRPLTTATNPQHSFGASALACSRISAFMAADSCITWSDQLQGMSQTEARCYRRNGTCNWQCACRTHPQHQLSRLRCHVKTVVI